MYHPSRGPLVLYSTNSWLSFAIAERYYRGIHWVWCSPFFRSDRGAAVSAAMPPTAIPGEIYDALVSQIRNGDRHSPFVERNKAGILHGAVCKKNAGVITKRKYAEILACVERAETRDFRPLLYVIPLHSVGRLAKEVPPDERAHPLSVEYRIEALARGCFDVIVTERV
jgi:hypothetical protein